MSVKDVFSKHAAALAEMGVNPNNGLGDVYDKLKNRSCATSSEIVADIEATYKTRPGTLLHCILTLMTVRDLKGQDNG